MRSVQHIIWWKCILWVAIGAGCGAVIASRFPQIGPPSGATRVMVERFAVMLTAEPTATREISNVILYPAHDGVRMITFSLVFNGDHSLAYVFANRPFLTAQRFKTVTGVGEFHNDSASAESLIYATTLRAATEQTLADVTARPHHQWDDAGEFLEHIKQVRGDFSYSVYWWMNNTWLLACSMAAGAVLIGASGAIFTRGGRDRFTPQPSESERLPELLVTTPLPIEPLPVMVETPEKEKNYAGEYYPTERKHEGFSLIELLVVLGMITVLMALLFPTVIGARRSADTIVCAANLHAIGQGMAIYTEQNKNTFPAAYEYIGQQIINHRQTPTHPSFGYVHWSSKLFGSVPPTAFTCPAMRQGGLPPTNTPPANRDAGQICPSNTVIDEQPPRLAYTVNEALCPRNKFIAPSFGAERFYRFVKSTEVSLASSTILATEMTQDTQAVSYGVSGSGWIMSHRPISGFVGLSGELDMYLIPAGQGFRRAACDDVDADPGTVGSGTRTRLDLVGRNHGKLTGYPDRRSSNFLYVDGHVQTKSVYDTVQPFEWGDRFYSLVENDDQTSLLR